MKITFLGTGAADFSPLLQTEYKDKLGRDVRRSSSILIEEQYLVDCGPHVLDSFRIQNLDCCKVTDLFVTHFHADHYNWECAAQLAAKTELPLRIWHHAGAKPDPVPNAVFCPLEPGEEQQNGTLKVKPLAANHSGWPLHYDFELDGQRMFYGCDGAWVLNDTFAAMRNDFYTREEVIAMTPLWKGERFEDGRPKVANRYLDALYSMTLEELWKPVICTAYTRL